MYAPLSIRTVPYLVHQAWKGNYTPYIDLYPKGKSSSFLAEGFYLCVTCIEDVPFIKEDEIEKQTAGTFMDRYRIKQQQQACSNWTKGNTAKNFQQPVVSSIPTLILSGAFDPVTPTSVAREIAAHLLKSKLVIIPNMAHVADGLGNEDCLDELVVNFFLNPERKINTDCVSSMKPPSYR